MIDDVIMHGTLLHLWKKKARKRCCWNCNIWPNWFTYHQSRYCLYYNGIPEFVRKRTMLTIKLLKQRKIFEISLSDSRIYKKWKTSAIIREISDSNLETGRNDSKSQVKSPGLSGSVNSPDVRYNFDLRSHVIAKHGTGSDEIAQWIAGRWQNNRLCQTNMSRGCYM